MLQIYLFYFKRFVVEFQHFLCRGNCKKAYWLSNKIQSASTFIFISGL